MGKVLAQLARPAAHLASSKHFSKRSNIFKQKKGAGLLFRSPLFGLVTCAAIFILTLREKILSTLPGDTPPPALPLANTAVDLALVPAVLGRHDLFLISAFYDARPLLFVAVPRVTLVALAEGSLLDRVEDDQEGIKFDCVFNSPTVWRVPAKVVRFGEWHHYKHVQPCYIHCNLEDVFAMWMAGKERVEIPERVSVSIAEDGTILHDNMEHISILVNQMPGAPFPPLHPPAAPCHNNPTKDCDTIGVCVPPIYDDAYHSTVERFFDHYRNLAEGNIKFIVYNASAGPLTSAALARSQLQHDLRIVHFAVENAAFPETHGLLGRVHQRGQSVQINDCMMRFAGRARWVGNIDLDEYIVPRCSDATSFREIFSLTSVLDTNHWANESAVPSYPSSYMFLHAFFYEDREKNAAGVGTNPLSPPQRALYRIPGFFAPGRRTKVFSNPIATLEQGIHYVEVFAAQEAWTTSGVATAAMRRIWDARRERVNYFEHLASMRSRVVYREAVISPHIAANHHIQLDVATDDLLTTESACDSSTCVLDTHGLGFNLSACLQASAADLQLIEDDEPPNYPNKFHYYQYIPRSQSDWRKELRDKLENAADD
jgi:hypothetical protein